MIDEQRRLAAIIFTDIVGYSALSQRDESLALRLLDIHNSLVRSTLKRHRGREVKNMGDGFMLEFPSALEAVRFAVDVQDEFRKYNLSAAIGEGLMIRIGVHVGDVESQGGDLFGDTVNIASRIAGFAEGGGICVSNQIYDQVRNKIQYSLVRMPRRQLKNIEQEVDLYRLVLPWETAVKQASNSINRIAVLPFSNISPDPGDSYFADGLTEELISVLSEIRGLRVIARTSVDHYKSADKDVKQIGNELDVAHLLGGSVRKVGGRIRITAHLIDVESQEEIWSERFEKDLVDVFSIQSEIAVRVADSLQVRLLSIDKTRIENKETENISAYIAYLKGRSLLREGTETAVHNAKRYFEQAIREDAHYAKAYAGLADTMLLLTDYLLSPVPVAIDKATKNVRIALSLDPNLAEARASLAFLDLFDYRFLEAEEEFKKAIEANPSYAAAHHWYSACLHSMGRTEDGMKELFQAEQLDPLSPSITLTVFYRLSDLGRYEEAEKRIRKLEEIEQDGPLVEEARMVYSFRRKDWDRAMVHLNKMIELDPNDPYLDMNKAYIYAVTGKREDALKLVEKLKEIPEDSRIRGQLLVFVFLGLGDIDSAFEWLNYAISKKEIFLSWMRGNPIFEPIKNDIRFNDALKAAGLPTN